LQAYRGEVSRDCFFCPYYLLLTWCVSSTGIWVLLADREKYQSSGGNTL
jgi:hypothetical protein